MGGEPGRSHRATGCFVGGWHIERPATAGPGGEASSAGLRSRGTLLAVWFSCFWAEGRDTDKVSLLQL